VTGGWSEGLMSLLSDANCSGRCLIDQGGEVTSNNLSFVLGVDLNVMDFVSSCGNDSNVGQFMNECIHVIQEMTKLLCNYDKRIISSICIKGKECCTIICLAFT